MTTRTEIVNFIKETVKNLQKEGVFNISTIPEIVVERPENAKHGDYSTPIALQLAKIIGQKPMGVAEIISKRLKNTELFEKTEIAPPGFINFFLSKDYLQKSTGHILKKQNQFGQINIGKNKKVNVEFISANPTGPLHVGNARGGFCGDVLSKVLEKAGYEVFREYYVNDEGENIRKLLKNSLVGKGPRYKNPYIEDLKSKKIKKINGAVRFIVKKIQGTVKRMGIAFDGWFYESSLQKERKWVVEYLLRKKLAYYDNQGTLWFKSEQFDDDKQRVLRKWSGEGTYFLSEIAYLKNKLQIRKFDDLIIFLGAEHHGYIARMKAGAKVLGYNGDMVRPIIMQLVHLVEGGKEVRMSKRAGLYVTIDELLDELGKEVGKKFAKDVARFFFLARGYDSHLNFDLDLAKEQSQNNPVFYVQYAHARLCSILRKAKINPTRSKQRDSKLINDPSELALIKQLIRLPEVVEDTAKDYEVHRLPHYAADLATAFHRFYRDCRVLSDDRVLSLARLNLLLATKIVLKNTLDLMGISAPEKM